jgi:uncharacterized membrane protein YgdD (TMEM256/DUF423 family)
MGLWLAAAGAHGLTAMVMGAFAAHALRARLDAAALGWIDTGSTYQMWHALALLAVGALASPRPTALLAWVGWAFFLGALLFSGGLYLLAVTAVQAFAWIVPVGGALLLLGWAGLIVCGIRAWRRSRR